MFYVLLLRRRSPVVYDSNWYVTPLVLLITTSVYDFCHTLCRYFSTLVVTQDSFGGETPKFVHKLLVGFKFKSRWKIYIVSLL